MSDSNIQNSDEIFKKFYVRVTVFDLISRAYDHSFNRYLMIINLMIINLKLIFIYL